MAELISVVVPIYNVEQYLRECVDSIVNQTYKNLEIILVDDGSLDNCPKICDEYSIVDQRIKVIHKQNGGQAEARNFGVDIANGKYICFVDADDYISPNMIEKLYDLLQKYKAEISVCAFTRFKDGDKPQNEVAHNTEYVKSGIETIRAIYSGKGEKIATGPWNKLYGRWLLEENDISFPSGRIFEDDLFTYKILSVAGRVAIQEQSYYYYRIREASTMTSTMSTKKCFDAIYINQEIINFFMQSQLPEFVNPATNYFCKSAARIYLRLLTSPVEEKGVCCRYVIDHFYEVIVLYKITRLKDFIHKLCYYLFFGVCSIHALKYKK